MTGIVRSSRRYVAMAAAGIVMIGTGSLGIAAAPERFTDRFDRETLGPWYVVHNLPQFAVRDGVLEGNQTNPDHSAVAIRIVPAFQDMRVEFDAKFGDLRQIGITLDDRLSTDKIHAGHIARLTVFPGSVNLSDDVARYNHEFRAAVPKDLRAEKLVGTFVSRQLDRSLSDNQWHRYAFEIRGDHARAEIDGVIVAELRSPGFAHPRKDQLALSVGGTADQLAQFDNFSFTPLR